MSKLFFMPRIFFDNKIFKPGLYFYSTEVLNKISLFGTLAMNIRNGSLMRGKAEYDLVFLAEYSKNFVTFFSNLYWIGRLISIGGYSPIKYNDNLVINNRLRDYDYYFVLLHALPMLFHLILSQLIILLPFLIILHLSKFFLFQIFSYL